VDPDGDYRAVNRECWNLLSLADDPELSEEDFENARRTLDPNGWIPWDEVTTVLCLAGAGGEQGPLFASLGCTVTVADISPGQLARDQEMADEYSLSIECVEADVCDLHELYGRDFDVVYQSISSVYIPDLYEMYREVAKVVRPGGLYVSEHWLSGQAQLAEESWDGTAYRIDKPLVREVPIPWESEDSPVGEGTVTCWHFLHTLDELLGGVCDAGFVIEGVRQSEEGDLDAEPGSDEHISAFVQPFISVLARRRA
jgi:SAM-dependent methyltransferase